MGQPRDESGGEDFMSKMITFYNRPTVITKQPVGQKMQTPKQQFDQRRIPSSNLLQFDSANLTVQYDDEDQEELFSEDYGSELFLDVDEDDSGSNINPNNFSKYEIIEIKDADNQSISMMHNDFDNMPSF